MNENNSNANEATSAIPCVMIVDDHLAISAPLQIHLQKHGFQVVAVVDQATSALAVVKVRQLDIVLMDIVMPGACPFETARQIKELSPNTHVLFFSGFPNDHYIDQVIETKASGFVSKTEPIEKLIFAMTQIMEGETYFSPAVEKRLVKNSANKIQSRLNRLSKREYEVLRLLVQDYSTKDVAESLNVSSSTVETHRRSLKNKLKIRGLAGLVRFAIREGLIHS